MKSPCFGCKERRVICTCEGKAVSCHSICQRYADFLRENERLKKKRAERSMAVGFSHDMAERVRKSIGFYKKNK